MRYQTSLPHTTGLLEAACCRRVAAEVAAAVDGVVSDATPTRILGGKFTLMGHPPEMVIAEKAVTTLQRGAINRRWREHTDLRSFPRQRNRQQTRGRSYGRWCSRSKRFQKTNAAAGRFSPKAPYRYCSKDLLDDSADGRGNFRMGSPVQCWRHIRSRCYGITSPPAPTRSNSSRRVRRSAASREPNEVSSIRSPMSFPVASITSPAAVR